jgi:hypothetical protein
VRLQSPLYPCLTRPRALCPGGPCTELHWN